MPAIDPGQRDSPAAGNPAALIVHDLTVEYDVRRNGRSTRFRAVDAVSLTVEHGECLGVVGQSGSGKSTLARAIVGLAPVSSGQVRVEGLDVADPRAGRKVHRKIGFVFQDPHGSLNPRMTLGHAVVENLVVQQRLPGAQRRPRARELLSLVGLPPEWIDRFPHEVSGGQRQRVCIARALAHHPALLILDEPVSSLDVSVQAEIINLLMDMQEQRGLSYMLISHDLALVTGCCDRTAVLHAGALVEVGPTARIWQAPASPHTRRLLDALPDRR